MKNRSFRFWQLSLLLISVFVFSVSLYLQYVQGLEPCALCIMQRSMVCFLIVLGGIGCFVSTKRKQNLIGGFEIAVSLAGVYFAARQVWLQSLPPDALPSCLPGLDVLLHYFPWQEIVQVLIWGSAECGEVSERILGVSLPSWTLIYFLGTALFVSATHLRRRQS